MGSKAQNTAEFFIFIGLAFLIAAAFEFASLRELYAFRVQKEDEAVKDLALKLQRELLIAAEVEDGYVRSFQIPNDLDRVNYTLTTQNSTITVESKNGIYIVSIPQSIGNVSKGANKINKTGGVIYINSKLSPFSNFNTCQTAQNNGLCSGLDLAYGQGYQAACCSEHGLCC